MPRIYKKIEVLSENQKNFLKNMGIEPDLLGLSQRKHLIMLINLLKPFFKDPLLSDKAKQAIIDFVENTYYLSSSYVRNDWTSLKNQIKSQAKHWSSLKRSFKINIDLLAKLREIYMVKLEKYGSDLAWEKMGWK